MNHVDILYVKHYDFLMQNTGLFSMFWIPPLPEFQYCGFFDGWLFTTTQLAAAALPAKCEFSFVQFQDVSHCISHQKKSPTNLPMCLGLRMSPGTPLLRDRQTIPTSLPAPRSVQNEEQREAFSRHVGNTEEEVYDRFRCVCARDFWQCWGHCESQPDGPGTASKTWYWCPEMLMEKNRVCYYSAPKHRSISLKNCFYHFCNRSAHLCPGLPPPPASHPTAGPIQSWGPPGGRMRDGRSKWPTSHAAAAAFVLKTNIWAATTPHFEAISSARCYRLCWRSRAMGDDSSLFISEAAAADEPLTEASKAAPAKSCGLVSFLLSHLSLPGSAHHFGLMP